MNRSQTRNITFAPGMAPYSSDPPEDSDTEMRWHIELCTSPEYLRVDLEGVFSMLKIPDLIADIVGQSFWQPGLAMLIDDRELDIGDITASNIETIAKIMRYVNHEFGRSYVAILTGSIVQFGFARQFQIRCESQSTAVIRAFQVETAAIEWLATSLPIKH